MIARPAGLPSSMGKSLRDHRGPRRSAEGGDRTGAPRCRDRPGDAAVHRAQQAARDLEDALAKLARFQRTGRLRGDLHEHPGACELDGQLGGPALDPRFELVVRPAQGFLGCGPLACHLRCLEGEREVVGKGRKEVDLLLVEVVRRVAVERNDADGAAGDLQREGR